MLTRILIAEDHSGMRTALKTLLETHAGWHVTAEAANGLEAVRKAADVKPDVVLLDFAMPEADGLQAAREISAASPDLPILMYTGLAFSPEDKMEAKRSVQDPIVNLDWSPPKDRMPSNHISRDDATRRQVQRIWDRFGEFESSPETPPHDVLKRYHTISIKLTRNRRAQFEQHQDHLLMNFARAPSRRRA